MIVRNGELAKVGALSTGASEKAHIPMQGVVPNPVKRFAEVFQEKWNDIEAAQQRAFPAISREHREVLSLQRDVHQLAFETEMCAKVADSIAHAFRSIQQAQG